MLSTSQINQLFEEEYYTNYEVHPCKQYLGFVQICEEDEADFWTVYGRLSIGGVDAIGDFLTRENAENVVRRIEGQKERIKKLIFDTFDNEELHLEAAENTKAFGDKIFNLLET